MSIPKISNYQKVNVWFNKKISILLAKRSKNRDYRVVEATVLSFFLDGLIINLSLLHFLPITILNIISLGAGAFIIKRVFPFVVQLINSINLIKVGK